MKKITETIGLESVSLNERPLIVCDVDEVVLEYITPFQRYLSSIGFELLPRSFRLTGNILALSDGREASREEMKEMEHEFYLTQEKWQFPVRDASAALARLAEQADIVFLTAMTPVHFETRRRLLDHNQMPYPMVATIEKKGPLVARLHNERHHPVVFLDDIFTNLHSVRDHVPDALLINIMANDDFRALAPDPGSDVLRLSKWAEAEAAIAAHFEGN